MLNVTCQYFWKRWGQGFSHGMRVHWFFPFFLCNWISISIWIMISFATTIFFYAHGFLLLLFLDYNLQLFWKLTVNSFEMKRSNSSPFPPSPPFILFFFLSLSLRIIMVSCIPLVMVSELNPLIKKWFFCCCLPWREARNVWCPPPVWNLRASHLIPLSYLLICFFCPFCLVIFQLMIYSPDFFPENLQIFLVKG